MLSALESVLFSLLVWGMIAAILAGAIALPIVAIRSLPNDSGACDWCRTPKSGDPECGGCGRGTDRVRRAGLYQFGAVLVVYMGMLALMLRPGARRPVITVYAEFMGQAGLFGILMTFVMLPYLLCAPHLVLVMWIRYRELNQRPAVRRGYIAMTVWAMLFASAACMVWFGWALSSWADAT